jgi:electron transport complex protein RnfE
MQIKNKYLKLFVDGLVAQNPLLVLMIGLCSALAVTSEVANGIGMGLSMTFVLLMSEIIVSLFRKLIPDSVRMPIFIIVIAAFTTMIDYFLQAFFPALSASMGLFIPLIVVNCIIMGRVEAFASKRPVLEAIPDALGMGIGYTIVLVLVSLVREVLGAGTILGFSIFGDWFTPIRFFAQAPGGFLVFACFVSFGLFLKAKMSGGAVDRNKAGCC